MQWNWMHLWINDVNDGCLATGERTNDKISKLQRGIARSFCSSVVRSPDQHCDGRGFDFYMELWNPSSSFTRYQSNIDIIYVINLRMHLTPFHLPYIMLNESYVFEPAVLAGYCVKKNPVIRPSSPGVPNAHWLEHLTGVTEVVDSIPAWTSEIFSVVPSSVAKQPSFTCWYMKVTHLNCCIFVSLVSWNTWLSCINNYNIPNNFRGLTLDKTDLVIQKPDDGYQTISAVRFDISRLILFRWKGNQETSEHLG